MISLLSLWMISTGVFLGAPTPFQAAWDVLEVVEHDQERLTASARGATPAQTSSTTRLSRKTYCLIVSCHIFSITMSCLPTFA